jgi:hypothetical protein
MNVAATAKVGPFAALGTRAAASYKPPLIGALGAGSWELRV